MAVIGRYLRSWLWVLDSRTLIVSRARAILKLPPTESHSKIEELASVSNFSRQTVRIF